MVNEKFTKGEFVFFFSCLVVLMVSGVLNFIVSFFIFLFAMLKGDTVIRLLAIGSMFFPVAIFVIFCVLTSIKKRS